MRFFGALLLLLSAVHVNGEGNPCTDSCISDPREPGDTVLNLANCQLEQDFISDLATCFDTVGRSSLTSVNLWGNSLTSLPSELFAGMTSLTYLNIELNSFTTLPDGIFNGLNSLETLWISNNEFVSLPEGIFDGLSKLDFLDMIITDLTSLSPGMFDGLTSLTYLGLSNNRIASLPSGIFDKLTLLEQLFLSDTGLTSVPAGIFDNVPLLSNLALSENSLTTLPSGLFDQFSLLSILSLGGNPELQCVPPFDDEDTWVRVDNEEILTSGECGCTPAEAVTCADGLSCVPGASGYTCEGTSANGYLLVGCYPDSKSDRLMAQGPMSQNPMSAEICSEICSTGDYTHFGTQYSKECWCSVDPDLAKSVEMLAIDECDMSCSGSPDGEYCGGRDKMTVYQYEYRGCYRDAIPRAMDAEGNYRPGAMTNEVCRAYCRERGHAFAGTQYASECFCGDSFDAYGKLDESGCSSPCQGDSADTCGGRWALSVYSTASGV